MLISASSLRPNTASYHCDHCILMLSIRIKHFHRPPHVDHLSTFPLVVYTYRICLSSLPLTSSKDDSSFKVVLVSELSSSLNMMIRRRMVVWNALKTASHVSLQR